MRKRKLTADGIAGCIALAFYGLFIIAALVAGALQIAALYKYVFS